MSGRGGGLRAALRRCCSARASGSPDDSRVRSGAVCRSGFRDGGRGGFPRRDAFRFPLRDGYLRAQAQMNLELNRERRGTKSGTRPRQWWSRSFPNPP